MKYFLRYTATPNADIERGESYHVTGLYDKEEFAQVAEQEGYEWNEFFGAYVEVLNGLCAFELDAEDLEEAIEEAETFKKADYKTTPESSYIICTGVIVGDCPEGEVIRVKEVLHVVKGENFQE